MSVFCHIQTSRKVSITWGQTASPIGPAGKANGVPRSCIRVLRLGIMAFKLYGATGIGFMML